MTLHDAFTALVVLVALGLHWRIGHLIAEQNVILTEQTSKAVARLSRAAEALESLARSALRAQEADEARFASEQAERSP